MKTKFCAIAAVFAALAAGAAGYQIDNSDRVAVARYVQCDGDAIRLLPALSPGEAASGHTENVKAEGGWTFDLEWRRSRISEMRLRSENGGTCRFHTAFEMTAPILRRVPGEDYTYELDTQKGDIFEFRADGALGRLAVRGGKAQSARVAVPPRGSTKARPVKPRPRIVTVGTKGDFATLQAAFDSIEPNDDGAIEIRLAPGRYREKTELKGKKAKIRLVATDSDPSKTVVSWNDTPKTIGPDGKELGTGGSRTLYIGVDDFEMEGITVENTGTPERLAATGGREQAGQCVALSVTGDRCVFRKCRFLGWQDTLYADGRSGLHPSRQYYEECYIEGAVDFIFGGAVALFNRCELRTVNGGYIAAARHTSDLPFGYVFYKCRVTAEPGKETYLGRPWRPFANVAFIGCDYTNAVRREGWRDWTEACGVRVWRSAEYDCRDASGPVKSRPDPIVTVGTARDLEKRLSEAGMKSILDILAAPDGWRIP